MTPRRFRATGQAARVAHLGLNTSTGQEALPSSTPFEQMITGKSASTASASVQATSRMRFDGVTMTAAAARQRVLARGRGHDALGQGDVAQVARVRMALVDGAAPPRAWGPAPPRAGPLPASNCCERHPHDPAPITAIFMVAYAFFSSSPILLSVPAIRRLIFSRCAQTTVRPATVQNSQPASRPRRSTARRTARAAAAMEPIRALRRHDEHDDEDGLAQRQAPTQLRTSRTGSPPPPRCLLAALEAQPRTEDVTPDATEERHGMVSYVTSAPGSDPPGSRNHVLERPGQHARPADPCRSRARTDTE